MEQRAASRESDIGLTRGEGTSLALTPSERRAVELLANEQPLQPKEMMDVLGIGKSRCYRILGSLVNKDVVLGQTDGSRQYDHRPPNLISLNPDRLADVVAACTSHVIETLESNGFDDAASQLREGVVGDT